MWRGILCVGFLSLRLRLFQIYSWLGYRSLLTRLFGSSWVLSLLSWLIWAELQTLRVATSVCVLLVSLFFGAALFKACVILDQRSVSNFSISSGIVSGEMGGRRSGRLLSSVLVSTLCQFWRAVGFAGAVWSSDAGFVVRVVIIAWWSEEWTVMFLLVKSACLGLFNHLLVDPYQVNCGATCILACYPKGRYTCWGAQAFQSVIQSTSRSLCLKAVSQ